MNVSSLELYDGKNETFVPEFLIESLWILEKNSGICIFEENYVDFTKDGVSSDLITSFLSALLTFAGETFTDEIQYIKFSSRKIFFVFSDHVLFVIAVNDMKDQGEIQVKSIQKLIAKRFHKRFSSIFKLENWYNEVNIFEDFSDDLKEIVRIDPINKKIVQSCQREKLGKICKYKKKFKEKF